MIFNSLSFVAFWTTCLICTLLVNRLSNSIKVRNLILLVASYWFYGLFSPLFLLLLVYITIINFVAGLVLDRCQNHVKKPCLSVAIILSIIPLLFYKYIGFILSNINAMFGLNFGETWISTIFLPVGISFFTFQTLSYTIDIYRQKIKPTTDLIAFSLFVSFFPIILSGPIERARNLLPQLLGMLKISLDGVISGVSLFTWGLFKKMVIADRLSEYVDWAYGAADTCSGTTLAFAAMLYSIQIYCDFSGYSDMAIGVARSLGINVMQNFKHPYFAHSIKEFWHRWHISLTSWFTEYVYFSLGGSRVKSRLRWIFNVSLIFILSGVWHGAAWNFIIWGCMHAVFYLIEYKLHLQPKEETHWWKYLKSIYVFVIVTVAWVFFRIEDMGKAWYIVRHSFTDGLHLITLGSSAFRTAETLTLLVMFLCLDFLAYKGIILRDNAKLFPFSIKNFCLIIFLWICISLFGALGTNFVYFQF